MCGVEAVGRLVSFYGWLSPGVPARARKERSRERGTRAVPQRVEGPQLGGRCFCDLLVW